MSRSKKMQKFKSRDELLSVVEEGHWDQFASFLKSFNKKECDLQEIISSCTKPQLDKLWDSTQQKCATTYMSLEIVDEDQMEEELKKVIEVLEGVVNLVSATINQQEVYIPVSLYSTSVFLNAVFSELPENEDKLKNKIAHLFETWWQKDLQNRDKLISNTLVYLLRRSLVKRTMADVKRVWLVHEALNQFDMANESSGNLKTLLEQCIFNTAYLKCSEGLRFLAYILSQDVELTKKLHSTIKDHIYTTPRSWLEKYGEIYFKAWLRATGPILEVIETNCLQDLMYLAIHTNKPHCQNLRRILGFIHSQKRQRGVEDMLLKLYDPILWRSHKVANPMVRLNATAISIEIFPLQNIQSTLEEADRLLQKQFDVLQILLVDPVPMVRVAAVTGVCKIMFLYWEIISATMIKSLMSKMFLELVWDASSADVRESVIKGAIVLLDNPLCHAILKPLLSKLQDLVHDSSEKNRIAMMDMLLKVKGIRAIKFWDIVTLEHLLVRLEIDDPPVCRRIMKLLFSNFMPLKHPIERQMERCVFLIQTNNGAAREFFNRAHNYMSIQDTVNYISLLCKCVQQCIRNESQRIGLDNSGAGEAEGNGEDEDQSQVDVSADELTIHDIKEMTGMIEAMYLIWNSIHGELDKTCNEEMLLELQSRFIVALPEMLKTFNEPQIVSALIMISGKLPRRSVPCVSRSCLSKLRNYEENDETDDYWCYLEAMCNWNKIGDVFEMVDDWIKASMPKPVKNIVASYATTIKGTTRKCVGFVEPQIPRPQLGLKYITSLIQHPRCRAMILFQHRDNMVDLIATLQDVRKCIEDRMTNRMPTEFDNYTDEFLVECFSMNLRLTVLLDDKGDYSAIPKINQAIAWANEIVIPVVESQDQGSVSSSVSNSAESSQSETKNVTQVALGRTLYNSQDYTMMSGSLSRKRSIGKATTFAINLASSVLHNLLRICSDVVLIGVANEDLSVHIYNFCMECLHADSSFKLLPQILTCFYQVTEYIILQHLTDDNNDHHDNLISEFIGKTLVALAIYVNENKEDGIKVLNSVKGAMIEILKSVYKTTVLDEAVIRDFGANVVSAILAELSNISRTLGLEESVDSFTSLPPLSAWLLDILFRKLFVTRNFMAELCRFIDSGAVTDLHNLLGASHLLATIVKCKPKSPGIKECWASIHREIEKLKRQHPEQLESITEMFSNFSCIEH